MKRVNGIGGGFLTARDAPGLRAWYQRHLGIDVQAWGGTAFPWTDSSGMPVAGTTAWSIFPAVEGPFAPSVSPFMINYRVDDLDGLLASLRAAGCAVDEKTHADDFGKFGWVMDPEGNRIELWEPPAKAPGA